MSFYIIEGANGSGKTTLINNLAKKGIKTLSSPNGTPLAQMLRPACRGTEPWKDIDKTVQFLLFSAARLDEYIRLVKDTKELIVADRWWTSTYVYQCVLQNLSVDFLQYTISPDEKVNGCIILDGKDDDLIQRRMADQQKLQSQGNCRWTQEIETMKKIMEIYRKELPIFLTCVKRIPVEFINVSENTPEQVLQKSLEIMK